VPIKDPYSILILQGNLALNASSPIQTVPSGFTYVLRDIQTRQTAGTNVSVYLRDTVTSNIILSVVPNTGAIASSWTGYTVLPENTQWQVVSAGANSGFWISGYQLTNIS
jgi:hypothetical protein